MKKIPVFFVVALIAFGAIAQEREHAAEYYLVPQAERGVVWIKDIKNKKVVTGISVQPKSSFSDLKYKLENDVIEIDTRDLIKNNPKAVVCLRYNAITYSQSDNLKKCFVQVKAGSTPANTKLRLFFEGATGKDNKHYWKAKNIALPADPAVVRFEQNLPKDLASLHIRCDLLSSGVYKLSDFSFGVCEESVIDESKNQIINGGAEAGFYNTALIGKDVLVKPAEGVSYDGRGRSFDKFCTLEIDSTTKHSGKSSFKFVSEKGSVGSFVFNSLKFLVGKPACFSVWIKAEKPKTKVSLTLYLSSGIAYVKEVTADTDWKQYVLMIPTWGDNAPSVTKINDVVGSSGALYGEVMPRISAKSTIWIDDAGFCLGRDPYSLNAKPSVIASAKLDNDSSVYDSGAKVAADFKLYSPVDKEVKVSWRLKDYDGKTVMSKELPEIKLQGGKDIAWHTDLMPPAGLRGALNWCFNIDGQAYNFYLGINPETLKQNKKLGINFMSRQNTDMAIKLLKKFRFGSVRLWSAFRELPYQGFTDVKDFHDNNFYVMMCLSNSVVAPRYFVPVDFTEYKKLLKEQAVKAKGLVDSYEMLNEPNIWTGRVRNPDPAKYQEMTPRANAMFIEASASVLKNVDDKVKIAGPTTCHTDIVWTENVLAAGAAKDLDIISEHPYREIPELPDYEEDLDRLKNTAARYGNKFSFVASEAGAVAVSHPANNLIDNSMRDQIWYNTRMMIIGWANGVDKYYHFSMTLDDFGTSWCMSKLGNPNNNCQSFPMPVMYALSFASDILDDYKPEARVKIGINRRAYVFSKDDERVVALWKWNGDEEKMYFKPELSDKIQAYDVMGTPIPANNIMLNKFPVYLRTNLSFKQIEESLISALAQPEGELFVPELIITGAKEFKINLKNRTGKPLEAEIISLGKNITKSSADGYVNIAPESFASFTFNTVSVISTSEHPAKFEVRTKGNKVQKIDYNLRALLVTRRVNDIIIDGKTADWNDYPELMVLTNKNAVKLKGWDKKEDKLTAKLKMAWDDDYLYLAFITNKPEYVANNIAPGGMWKFDSIQIAFDPLKNAAANQLGYQDDDYEFSAGVFNDKPLVFMHRSAAATYDSVNKPAGIVESVKSAVRTDENGNTVYELAFPKLLVSPFRLEAGSSMRFNLLLNINNGKQRVGWLELTPGIGSAPKKPGAFMGLVLIK